MKRDITIAEGHRDRPVAVFIHGLGMNKCIWESPDQANVLGGKFPVALFAAREPRPEPREKHEQKGLSGRFYLGERPTNLTTLFHTLKELGYTVIVWSQKRPSAEIDSAVSELKDIVAIAGDYGKAGVVLIGHSRGGLIARKYLAGGDKKIRCIFTLATPHKGSRMARWVEYLSPLTSFIHRLLPDSEKGTATYAAKKTFDFLRSTAVKELLPDSPFFRSLADRPIKGTYYISVGGRKPTLFSVYRSVIERFPDGDKEGYVMKSAKVFSVPDILEKVVPATLFPDEMKHGRGDGFVSAESSRLPWCDEHYDFDLNHAEVLFDERVKQVVVNALNHL
jgi:pimeloyl-ACP methyl ester carboxylesterase